mgnify:CR=1 FL=1
MKDINDEHVKLAVEARLQKIKEGRVCYRQARAVYRTYRQIKTEGYDRLSKEKNTTFFRNVKLLEKCGISRATLKALDPTHPNSCSIPMLDVIKIDFRNQRPDWYQEPVAGYEDERRHLKLVG